MTSKPEKRFIAGAKYVGDDALNAEWFKELLHEWSTHVEERFTLWRPYAMLGPLGIFPSKRMFDLDQPIICDAQNLYEYDEGEDDMIYTHHCIFTSSCERFGAFGEFYDALVRGARRYKPTSLEAVKAAARGIVKNATVAAKTMEPRGVVLVPLEDGSCKPWVFFSERKSGKKTKLVPLDQLQTLCSLGGKVFKVNASAEKAYKNAEDAVHVFSLRGLYIGSVHTMICRETKAKCAEAIRVAVGREKKR